MYKSTILILIILFLFFATPAFAPPSPSIGSELSPSSAYDPVNDRHLLVYVLYTAIGTDIYGRFMDTEGQPDGADFAISDQSDTQQGPDVTYDSDNQSFLVVWYDNRDTDYNIYGQFINASTGALIDYASNVNFPITNEGNPQFAPAVASNALANRILVTWEDTRAGNYDIYGQFINSLDGTYLFNTVSQNFHIANTNGNHFFPDLAYDSTGDRFLVTWVDYRNASTDIYGQFVNSLDGSLMFNTAGVNFPITNATGNQNLSAVSYDTTGNRFLVVWQDGRNASSDIYGQLVDASDGSLPVSIINTNIAISTATAAQTYTTVASTGYGAYLVAWQDARGGAQTRIFGQDIDASDGSLISNTASTNLLIMQSSDYLYSPALSHDPDIDRFLVSATWDDGSNNFGITSIIYPEVSDDDDGGDGGDAGSSGGGGGGCFIATAAYGSYSDSHVIVLRNFRDEVLFKSEFGTALVDMYYAYSPPVANFIAKHPAIRAAVRLALAPVVYTVKYPVLMGFAFASLGGALIGIRRRRK